MPNRWREWVEEKPEAEAGVYVLVAGNDRVRKLVDGDSVGVLYIGESSNLMTRPNFRTGTGFDHSTLSYLFDFQGEVDPSLPLPSIVLPYGSGETEWRKIPNLDQPRLLYTYEANHKKLEQVLLVKHFFQCGQYPPFNTSCPSLKSIYLNWKDRWAHDWSSLNVDKAWDELMQQES